MPRPVGSQALQGLYDDELPNCDIVKEHHITPKEVDVLEKEPPSQQWRARQQAERRALEPSQAGGSEEKVVDEQDMSSLWRRREENISWKYIMSIRNGRRSQYKTTVIL